MNYKYISFEGNEYDVTLPNVILENNKKIVKVYGDSFCSLESHLMYKHNSWLTIVGNYFNAKIESFGIPGASESTILYTYLQDYKNYRDYTIFVHTHPDREDRYFDTLSNVNFDLHLKWEKLIKENSLPCIHLYWSVPKYRAKTGKSLFFTYWINTPGHSYDTTGDLLLNRNIQSKNIHHMTLADNKKLAEDVIKKMIKDFR